MAAAARLLALAPLLLLALACRGTAAQEQTAPAPESRWPQLLGAQYTFIEQWQTALDSPYAGPLSLHADGDRQGTHTIGFYGGWAPAAREDARFDAGAIVLDLAGASAALITLRAG